MKLGTKVKCTAYLKKVPTKHISPTFIPEEDDDYYLHMGGVRVEDEKTQITKEIIKKEFEGIIVAFKEIPMERYFDIGDDPYTGKEYMNISNGRYTPCYLVFFRMGGSRLVPINHCEVLEG